MRLSTLEDGHRTRAKLFLAVARRLGGGEEADDVVKFFLYRPDLLGGPTWTGLVRSSLRGPSEWTEAQREMFASVTSRANTCEFCADIHSRTTHLLSGKDVDQAAPSSLDDVQLTAQEAATIGLLERVTNDPDGVTAADVDAVRATGVSDDAIADALVICFLFNLINRCVDAFEFGWDSDEHRAAGAKALIRFGYKIPKFVVR